MRYQGRRRARPLERLRQRMEGVVAIGQIDPLLPDTERRAILHKQVIERAGELLPRAAQPVFDHDESTFHLIGIFSPPVPRPP